MKNASGCIGISTSGTQRDKKLENIKKLVCCQMSWACKKCLMEFFIKVENSKKQSIVILLSAPIIIKVEEYANPQLFNLSLLYPFKFQTSGSATPIKLYKVYGPYLTSNIFKL